MHAPRVMRTAITACGLPILAACGGSDPAAPADSDVVLSETGIYQATLELDPESPRVGANELWLTLEDKEGEPVSGARVEKVEPWMPMHGHGSTTTPTVTEPEPARYHITDLVYTMPGLWEVRIDLEADAGADRFVLEFDVE